MPIKLPQIQQGGVRRLVTPDPMLPVREAGARASMLSAVGAAAGTAASMASRYIEREDRREVQDAALQVHERDTAFVSSNKGKEEYSIMDTEDSNFLDLADQLGYENPNDSVPAHRVYAEWRQKNYQTAIDEAASKISNRRSREEFIKQHKAKGQSLYADDSVAATKAQIKYTATKTMERVEKSILNRDFGGARLAVEISGMSTDAKSRALDSIDTREQSDYFNEAIERRDLGVMELALDQLIKNDPKVTSKLPADEQKVFANQLRTAINGERTAINSAANSSLQIQVADAKTQMSDIWGNKPVDMTEYLSNYKAIKGKHPVVAREMEWTQKHQPAISEIMMSPPSVQVATLQELKEKSTGDRETSYIINRLEDSIEQGQIARRTDSTKWAADTGFVALSPIDYSSPESIQQTLSERVKPILSIQRRFGTFTGFLTKDELVEFGSRLENAPNKLEYFANINGALGEYSEPFYEQLKKYNIGETATLAGQIMTWGEGYRPVAENILKGANLRKTDNLTQLKMKDANSELDAFAVARFSGIFTGNKKQQSLNVEAFKDIYAVTGDKEEAFNQLTGGTIDFKGYTLQAPVPGMSGWAYKKYLNDLAPEYWKAPEMRAYGWTPEQLQKNVLNGNLKQAGAGRGVSYLETDDGMRVKQIDGVTDFLFRFDPDAPTKSGKRRAILEEAEEAALRKKQIEAATATYGRAHMILGGG